MMATEVESCKADPIDGELLGSGVQCGNMLRHTVILQHVKQRCLAGIVQSKEQQFPRFLPEAEVAQCTSDPLPKEHVEAVAFNKPRYVGMISKRFDTSQTHSYRDF